MFHKVITVSMDLSHTLVVLNVE